VGIIEAIREALSPRSRMLRRLAVLAGENERLAASIKRHAAMCDSPTLKSGLETAASAEAADAQALRVMLLTQDLWPTRSSARTSEGANHWARIGADLAAEVELVRSLNAAVAEWEGVDPGIAERLRELETGKEQTRGLLRDLTLKCDPQALD
jgi:hypothetical protein